MQTLNGLKAETAIFFNKHWGFPTTAPEWQTCNNFLTTSVPNYDKGGCYALFEGDTLVYIGKGISRGTPRYVEHGISRRMMKHIYKGESQRELTETWVKRHITSCATIGFDTDQTYLAVALEVFLIRKLLPKYNPQV